MRKSLHIFRNVDRITVIILILMVLLGWLNLHSTETTGSGQALIDFTRNDGRQFLWMISAILLALGVLMFDARFFQTFSWPIYGMGLLILVAVLLFGTEINASKSWFRIGGVAIQPSEFVKYATALALARFIHGLKGRTHGFGALVKTLLILALPVALIFLQNDTGTALVFFAFCFPMFREGMIGSGVLAAALAAIILFVLTLLINEFIIIGAMAGITFITALVIRKRTRELRQVLLIFVVLSVYAYSVDYLYEEVLQPHQKLRIEVLIDEHVDLQGAGYNLHQSKIAIGSGGLWGKGYRQGTQTQFNFVPEQSTDFIFCTIGEEWGFAGSALVVALFAALLFRLLQLAERQKSTFSRVFGYGVLSVLFVHFSVNIGMTIGLVPVIGIPLPFFSYGGSSLWAFTIMIFTFLKLDARRMDII